VGEAVARAAAATHLSLVPESRLRQLQALHGFAGTDTSSLAIHVCRVICLSPKR
jgi:endonuclease/exonuclease/phosphatase family metal-dependent hydrolase